jgi:hypothetical protein
MFLTDIEKLEHFLHVSVYVFLIVLCPDYMELFPGNYLKPIGEVYNVEDVVEANLEKGPRYLSVEILFLMPTHRRYTSLRQPPPQGA